MKEKLYCVTLVKRRSYIVKAENEDAAIDAACDYNADKDEDISWILDPVDEFICEEVDKDGKPICNN